VLAWIHAKSKVLRQMEQKRHMDMYIDVRKSNMRKKKKRIPLFVFISEKKTEKKLA